MRTAPTPQQVFEKALVAIGVPEEGAHILSLGWEAFPLQVIPEINELLTTGEKGDLVFCLNEIGHADLYMVEQVENGYATAMGFVKTRTRFGLVSNGYTFPVEILHKSCIKIPRDKEESAQEALAKCRDFYEECRYYESMKKPWWVAHQIATLLDDIKRS